MRNYLPFLGSVLLLLSSCSQSPDLDASGVQANFGDEVRFTTPATRMSDDQWGDDDRVGVYSGTSTYTNIEYTVEDNDSLTPAGEDKIYYLTNEETVYYAYYPYSSAVEGTTYSINLTDQSDLAAIDLIWSRSSSTTAEVEFEFEHKLSKIYLTVNYEAGFTTPPTCSIYGVAAAADFSLISGLVSEEYAATIKGVVGELTTDSKSVSYEMLLLPSIDLSELWFVFEYDGSKYLYAPSVSDISAWEAGLSYNYETTLTGAVSEVYIESLTLDTTEVSGLSIGDTLQLTATYAPSYATETTITWSSDDEDVATVSAAGLVTATGFGDAVITATATAEDGSDITATCTVNVPRIYITALSLDITESIVLVDETLQLTASWTPEGATETTVEWSSSDDAIATVSTAGLVEVLAVGDAVITATATAEDGSKITATCDIYGYLVNVGSYIYSDGTYSSTYDSGKIVSGVVYLVNDDRCSGKAMYPGEWANTEANAKAWCLATSAYYSTELTSSDTSFTEGLKDMKAIYDVDDSFAEFEIYAWVADLNTSILGKTSAVDYSAISDDEPFVYYLPTYAEYMNEIYPEYWKDVTSTSLNRTSDFAVGIGKAGTQFTAGSGNPLATSTQAATAENTYWVYYKSTAPYGEATSGKAKSTAEKNYRIRAVMMFDLTPDAN